jgi:hypothetical protein
MDIDLQVATGVRAFEDAVRDFYDKKILKEGEERFRCELCSKMFKSRLFVEKHMSLKHQANMKDIETNVCHNIMLDSDTGRRWKSNFIEIITHTDNESSLLNNTCFLMMKLKSKKK